MKIDESIQCMEECLKLIPQNQNKLIERTYFYIGILYLNIRNKEKALIVFNQLNSINSEFAKDLNKLIQMWN